MKRACGCPDHECHAVGVPGCYFGTTDRFGSTPWTPLHDHPRGDTTCPECWTPERRTESETR